MIASLTSWRAGRPAARASLWSAQGRSSRGFSLIELLIVVAVIGILTFLAYPSYTRYLVRVSRETAQTSLLQLAGLQEKIFLNSSSYVFGGGKVTAAYNGNASGGLGLTSGTTPDGKYTISVTGTATTFKLTATPDPASIQANDGLISIDDAGTRLWGSKSW